MTPAEVYMEAIRGGMQASDAFKKAWPNGLPTAKDRAKAQADSQQKGTLASLAGVVGGSVGAKYLVNALSGGGAEAATTATTGATAQGAATAEAANTAASTTATQTASSSAAYPVGTAADGGTIMSDGSVASSNGSLTATSTAGNVIGAALAAKGTYDTAKGWDNGGEGMRSGLTTAGAGIGTLVAGPLGTGVGALAGNALGYGMQGNGWKNDAALVALGPVGWAGLAAKKLGYANRKTTKQFQQDRWSKLGDTPGAANAYLANHAANDDGVWDSGKYAGQKWSFEKANELAKTGQDFNEVLGNYQADKNWGTYTPEQKQAITNQAAQKGLYEGNKGDVLVKDKAAFQNIINQVVGGNPVTNQPTPQARVSGNPMQSSYKPVITVNPKLALALNKQNQQAQVDIAKQNLK